MTITLGFWMSIKNMQTYERIDIRKRTKELTDIEFGSKKGNPETISLFDE